ncbi:MAG: DUF2269 family protein [Spirochaetales bacterium]|nr:DUF2269 family protein [Spirochaetales bacterium]
MKSKHILIVLLCLMGIMILAAVLFPQQLTELLNRPVLYPHVLFAHILSVSLFFANAVAGMLWESRSLKSGNKDVILHTYRTVSWLDARFSSPLIILSVMTGIMLSIMWGDLWQIGWLSLAFLLFLFSGAVWVISDIPTQYKVKKLIAGVHPEDSALPRELLDLLKLRLWVSLAGVLPLLLVFILMVYKPEITPVAEWFK